MDVNCNREMRYFKIKFYLIQYQIVRSAFLWYDNKYKAEIQAKYNVNNKKYKSEVKVWPLVIRSYGNY